MGVLGDIFGGGQQTAKSSAGPWKPTQPALKYATNRALDLTKKGVGGNVYQGSTVTPFNWRTQEGMKNMGLAAQGAQGDMNQSFNNIASQSQNGGLNQLQQQQVDRLQGMADGSMLFGNPNVQKMIDMNARDIGGASNLMASAAGRYGSGGHQGVTQRNVGDMATRVRADDYNRERGFMQDAIGSLYNAGQQQQENQIMNNQALQGAYQGMMQPGQTMMDIGGQYEDLNTRQINDKIRRFEGKDNAEWNRLGMLNGIATGAGGMGSTQKTTAQGPSRLMQGLGGAMGGYSMFGPMGALGGGLLGMFG
jgi:hypothetical protein